MGEPPRLAAVSSVKPLADGGQVIVAVPPERAMSRLGTVTTAAGGFSGSVKSTQAK